MSFSVYLDDAVDFSHKEEAGEKSHSSSEKEEDHHHNQCVAEVQEGGGCSCYGQFGDKEMNRVQKEIHRSTATSQEGTPPPVIILSTKMEITQQYGGL